MLFSIKPPPAPLPEPAVGSIRNSTRFALWPRRVTRPDGNRAWAWLESVLVEEEYVHVEDPSPDGMWDIYNIWQVCRITAIRDLP